MSVAKNILQWKFTACQYNIENANGFKTFSMSEGLTLNDKEDLIQAAGNYTRPEYLPDRPTPEEIKTFPVMFLSFRLRSGKSAIVQTSYVGRDYAGVRWGNFFSHALVLPAGNWPFYPIQLWNSPVFQKGLTDEELQITCTPPPLPTLEIDEPHLHDWTTDLDKFLGGNAERQRGVFSLIAAVRSERKTGKNVLLKDVGENIPLWAAAVQYAFPAKWAHEISLVLNVQSSTNLRKFHLAAASDKEMSVFIQTPATATQRVVFDFGAGNAPIIPVTGRWFGMLSAGTPPYPGKILTKLNKEHFPEWDCSPFDDTPERAIGLITFLFTGTAAKKRSSEYTGGITLDDRETELDLATKESLDFFAKQPLNNRIFGAKKILSDPKPYDRPTLGVLFPLLNDVVRDSKDESIKKSFISFFINQFCAEIERIDIIDSDAENHQYFNAPKYFELLKQYFSSSDSFRNNLGKEILQNLSDSSRGKLDEKRYFLEMSLFLILHPSDFCDYLIWFKANRLNALAPQNRKKLLESMFRAVIEKCDEAKKHEQFINLYTYYNVIDDFYTAYITELSKYGGKEWKEGRRAMPQATSFLKYLVQIPIPKNDQQKTTNDNHFDKFISHDRNRRPLLWRMMGIKNPSKQQQEIDLEQIYKILTKELNISDNDPRRRLKSILERKSWIEKNFIILLVLFTTVGLSVILAAILFFTLIKSPVPGSVPVVQKEQTIDDADTITNTDYSDSNEKEK